MLAKVGASRALSTAASFFPCKSFKTGSPQVAGVGEAKWDTALSAAESAQSLVLQWYPNSRRHAPQEQRSACISQVPSETWKWSLFLRWGKEGPKSVSIVSLSTDSPQPKRPQDKLFPRDFPVGYSSCLLATTVASQDESHRVPRAGFCPDALFLSSLHRGPWDNEGQERRSLSFGCVKGTQVSPQSGGEEGAEDARPHSRSQPRARV